MFSGFTYERMVHYRDHIHNPHINYIRLNNCKYCKQDRRDFFGSQYRNPNISHSNRANMDLRNYRRVRKRLQL